MDPSFIIIILQLIFLECILSIDNAAVLGAMVAPLPNDQPVPWPRFLRAFLSKLDPILGPQRQAALKVGLLGAYAGRILMLLLASIIISNPWMQIVGALYLVYLASKHLGGAYHHSRDDATEAGSIKMTKTDFWSVVITIELADLAFSLDNVITAVALSDHLWVVILGVAIGIVVMRFAATIFTRLIAWEPALETAAYLLLLAIGSEILIEHYLHFELSTWQQFGISVGVIVLVVVFARVKALRPLLLIFRPFVALLALINAAVGLVMRVLTAPVRMLRPAKQEEPY
jgi:tellurite resistance protein TerC